MRARIIAALIVCDGGVARRGFHDGFERQCTTGIFKENPLTLHIAMVDLSEAVSDLLLDFRCHRCHGCRCLVIWLAEKLVRPDYP